jgi:Lar family restriction alleviation protein
MSQELRNCPFCGEPPSFHSTDASTWIGCESKTCRVSVDVEVADFDETDHRSAAIDAWNRRPGAVAAEQFVRIIDQIEVRCMAVDGPVTPTLNEMSEAELAELWRHAQAIKSAAEAQS